MLCFLMLAIWFTLPPEHGSSMFLRIVQFSITLHGVTFKKTNLLVPCYFPGLHLYPEKRSSTFIRNVGKIPPKHTTSHTTKQLYLHGLLVDPEDGDVFL
jgi:hypothetical protein